MVLEELKKCVEEYIAPRELFLVEVHCSASNEIEVVVDSIRGVTLDDCAAITRHIESVFDREKEDYELTVASASLSEPFKVMAQYHKHMGKEVAVVLKTGEKISGEMTAADDQGITLVFSKKVLEEGKKRKVLKAFTESFHHEAVKSVSLILKF